METSVTSVTKMGNTVPRAGIKPTSLAFQASVNHAGTLMSPIYPRPPVCAALGSGVSAYYYKRL